MMRGGHQPFARGPRAPGQSLRAMMRGAPTYLPNPMDIQRQAMKLSRPRRQRLANLLRRMS